MSTESPNTPENGKEPKWLNALLLAATLLTVVLVMLAAYRGWQEDRGLHLGQEAHSSVIADITVNLGGLPQQEHCLTCHPLGKAFHRSGGAMLMRAHPSIVPHSMDDLGCTGCHLGEGMARDLRISHGNLGQGARKVLAGKDLQAGCYRCHDLKPLRGAEKAWEGFQLFSQNACDSCHSVEGLGGGVYGPSLSEVGSFLGLKQIRKAIEEPRAEPENSIMPKFSFSPGQIQSLSYFLKSRVREPLFETPMIRRARIRGQALAAGSGTKKNPASAAEILREKRCLACHKFQEEDGQIAPDLTFQAFMRSEDYIRSFLHSPGKEIPGAMMPWIRLNREAEDGIVRALQKRSEESRPHGTRPKHLYMQLCQRCHAAQGDGLGTIQPNLANLPRGFWKNGEFFRRIPDERIVKSIEEGIPGTSMPPYGKLLGREAVDSVVDLLFGEFMRIKRDDKRNDLAIPSRPETLPDMEKRKKIFEKFCVSCHGVAGNGKGPEYLKHLPRPRDLTNRPYFQSLGDERIVRSIYYGVPGTAMIGFAAKFSPEALWAMASRIRELSGADGKTGRKN